MAIEAIPGHEIARALIYDFGLEGALRYAKRKSASADPFFAAQYWEAIPHIEARIEKSKAEQASEPRKPWTMH